VSYRTLWAQGTNNIMHPTSWLILRKRNMGGDFYTPPVFRETCSWHVRSTSSLAGPEKGEGKIGNLNKLCRFAGTWVQHSDPGYLGLYDVRSCPKYIQYFNCLEPSRPTPKLSLPLLRKAELEYNMVINPGSYTLVL
jgi:hypothetical protein